MGLSPRRKEALSPLVQAEAIEVRRRSDAFQARVEGFRAFFQKSAPFAAPDTRLGLEHVSLTLFLPAVPRQAGHPLMRVLPSRCEGHTQRYRLCRRPVYPPGRA